MVNSFVSGGYVRVYLLLEKVAETPSHIQGDGLSSIF